MQLYDDMKETTEETYQTVKRKLHDTRKGARTLTGALALSVGLLGGVTACDDQPFEPTDGKGQTEQVAGPYAENDNNLTRLGINEIEESAIKIHGNGMWEKVEDGEADQNVARVYQPEEGNSVCREAVGSDAECFVIDYQDGRDILFPLSGEMEEKREDSSDFVVFSWSGTGGAFLNTDYDNDGDEDTLIGTVDHVVNPPEQIMFQGEVYELEGKNLFYEKDVEGQNLPVRQPIEVEYSDWLRDIAVASSEAVEDAYNLFYQKESLKKGHFLMHIGNPLSFEGVYTDGKVSNTSVFGDAFFTTQMPVNPGDSGSPSYVLNEEDGEPYIAGYVSWGIPSAEDIGGISHAANLLQLLERNGANLQVSGNAVQLEAGTLEGEIDINPHDFDPERFQDRLRE